MHEIDNNICFLLHKTLQRSLVLLREEIGHYGLTPSQFVLLACLWQQEGLTQVELSNKSQIDRTTIGGLINRLEKNGLLERRPHHQDSRTNQIYLTERSKDLEILLSQCALNSQDKFINVLNENEVKELTRILKILRGYTNITLLRDIHPNSISQ